MVNGLPHGKCHMKFSEDSYYWGEMTKGVRHGKGELKLDNGFTFNGQWVNGLFEGKGVCTYPDGSQYDGSWKAGKRDGRGTLRLADDNAVKLAVKFVDDEILQGTGTVAVTKTVSVGPDEWMIPFDLLGDVPKIHLRAGFDPRGN